MAKLSRSRGVFGGVGNRGVRGQGGATGRRWEARAGRSAK